ncbi:hypothetical protein PWT90_01599 [Aphanocladium album]|nr:hypothetical protein PWT90_01599 [Aphanocladium album]
MDDLHSDLIREHAIPLSSADTVGDGLSSYLDSFADCKVLLLGDASHGTSEFYTSRTEITKCMIEHHGFNVVAVKAGWPDAEAVDRYVRRRPGPGPRNNVKPGTNSEAYRRSAAFSRLPTWMWRNMKVHDLVTGLHKHNNGRPEAEATGFYGLDLYSMRTSMEAVIKYLEQIEPEMAKKGAGSLREADDVCGVKLPHSYGLETIVAGFKGYEKDVLVMLRDLLKTRMEYSAKWWNGTRVSQQREKRQTRG